MADEQYYTPRERRPYTWAWLLLLPLFFVLGWLANSYWGTNTNQYQPQAGVGGGPANTHNSPFVNPRLTPSITVTPKVTPTVFPTSIIPTETVTMPGGTR